MSSYSAEVLDRVFKTIEDRHTEFKTVKTLIAGPYDCSSGARRKSRKNLAKKPLKP